MSSFGRLENYGVSGACGCLFPFVYAYRHSQEIAKCHGAEKAAHIALMIFEIIPFFNFVVALIDSSLGSRKFILLNSMQAELEGERKTAASLAIGKSAEATPNPWHRFLQKLWYDQSGPVPGSLKPMHDISPFYNQSTAYSSALERKIIEDILTNYPDRQTKLVYFGVTSNILNDWIIIARLVALGYKNFEINISDAKYPGGSDNETLRKAVKAFETSLADMGGNISLNLHSEFDFMRSSYYPFNIHICCLNHPTKMQELLHSRLADKGKLYIIDFSNSSEVYAPPHKIQVINKEKKVEVPNEFMGLVCWANEKFIRPDTFEWLPKWSEEFPGIKLGMMINGRFYPV